MPSQPVVVQGSAPPSRYDRFVDLAQLEIETFPCPRCHREVTERLYGPCSTCREDLGDTIRRSGESPVIAAEYVPKMNVTPNQVATKE